MAKTEQSFPRNFTGEIHFIKISFSYKKDQSFIQPHALMRERWQHQGLLQ